MKTEKQHVALTICFYCGESDRILLATKYNRQRDGSISPVHDLAPMDHKVIDMEPCAKCAEYMKQGIILIGIDEKLSNPGWNKGPIPDPWRTGHFFVVKEEAFKRVFEGKAAEFALKHRFMLIDKEAIKETGLSRLAPKEE
jgi:hypothetical protein